MYWMTIYIYIAPYIEYIEHMVESCWRYANMPIHGGPWARKSHDRTTETIKHTYIIHLTVGFDMFAWNPGGCNRSRARHERMTLDPACLLCGSMTCCHVETPSWMTAGVWAPGICRCFVAARAAQSDSWAYCNDNYNIKVKVQLVQLPKQHERLQAVAAFPPQ